MNAPMTTRQFFKHWKQYVDREVRTKVMLPASQHFSLDDMEAELIKTIAKDPMAGMFSMRVLVKEIVKRTDRSRRPNVEDVKKQKEDLFHLEHKWIPLGKNDRVRYCDATTLDLNEWLLILNNQYKAQSEAYTTMVAQIQHEIGALLRSGQTTVGDLWRTELGWTPTKPKDDDDEDEDDE